VAAAAAERLQAPRGTAPTGPREALKAKKAGIHHAGLFFRSIGLKGGPPCAIYSQQGIVTSSQQSSSQQDAAANAAVDARARAKMARSFFMRVLEG